VGSFPGRKLVGCFSRNEIAMGPRENAFPGPAVALEGPVQQHVSCNSANSVAIRIGPRYNCTSVDLILCNKPLACISSVQYL